MEKAAKGVGGILVLAGTFALVQWLFGTTEDRQWKISIITLMAVWGLWSLHMAGLWNSKAKQNLPLWIRASFVAAGVCFPAYFVLFTLSGLDLKWLGLIGGASFFLAIIGITIQNTRNGTL